MSARQCQIWSIFAYRLRGGCVIALPKEEAPPERGFWCMDQRRQVPTTFSLLALRRRILGEHGSCGRTAQIQCAAVALVVEAHAQSMLRLSRRPQGLLRRPPGPTFGSSVRSVPAICAGAENITVMVHGAVASDSDAR